MVPFVPRKPGAGKIVRRGVSQFHHETAVYALDIHEKRISFGFGCNRQVGRVDRLGRLLEPRARAEDKQNDRSSEEQIGLYAVVFQASRLYADMGLQVVYVIVSFYGWYQWLYGGENHTELKVSKTPQKLAVFLTFIGLSFALLLGTVLHRTTNAALPYLDSLTTSTSLVAQWMMTESFSKTGWYGWRWT